MSGRLAPVHLSKLEEPRKNTEGLLGKLRNKFGSGNFGRVIELYLFGRNLLRLQIALNQKRNKVKSQIQKL
jgi:hypothetical protein